MQLLHIILYGLKQVNGERTAASIYHLVKGKRSSQTLQDGTMYHVSFLFGIYKKLNRHKYDEQICMLLTEKWIKKIQENTYILTAAGEIELNRYCNMYPFPEHLHGLQYGEAGDLFWKRYSLIVQTVSHLQFRTAFLPIQQELEVTRWVKHFLLSLSYSREQLRDMLYTECEKLLSSVREEEAAIFVLRLTGAERVGYTREQLSKVFHIDVFQVHLMFLGVLHFIVKTIMSNRGQYPLLEKLIPATDIRSASLSLSTQKTYELWKQGKSLGEIAIIRSLKQNTIEDHIVEIAMNQPDFPISLFVSAETIAKVKDAVSRLQTRKLRLLKQHAGEEVDYFSIRLVLATLGGSYEA